MEKTDFSTECECLADRASIAYRSRSLKLDRCWGLILMACCCKLNARQPELPAKDRQPALF